MTKRTKKGSGSKKIKDMDPKARAKKVKGGINVWQDNKDSVPLGMGKVVDDVVVKPLQNSPRTITRP